MRDLSSAEHAEKSRRKFTGCTPLVGIAVLVGCGTPGREIGFVEGDFALIEVALQSCSSNQQFIGLENSLLRLYGTRPQIDLDRQFARVRVKQSRAFDFSTLADEVRRNNAGVAGIAVTAMATIKEGGRIEIQATGQSFSLVGNHAGESAPKLRTLHILEWGDPARTHVAIAE